MGRLGVDCEQAVAIVGQIVGIKKAYEDITDQIQAGNVSLGQVQQQLYSFEAQVAQKREQLEAMGYADWVESTGRGVSWSASKSFYDSIRDACEIDSGRTGNFLPVSSNADSIIDTSKGGVSSTFGDYFGGPDPIPKFDTSPGSFFGGLKEGFDNLGQAFSTTGAGIQAIVSKFTGLTLWWLPIAFLLYILISVAGFGLRGQFGGLTVGAGKR